MSKAELRIAVVGHTNTGKTSLMRTLLRDVSFGEVSDRPAVTRTVEGAALPLPGAVASADAAGGDARVLLYDTPGLEDSISLLDYLNDIRGEARIDGIDLIKQLLEGPESQDRFSQECKALRQVIDSDVAFYVIDARDRVLGKHRDELTILGYCARPIVPVLNFVASPEARVEEWREHLSRVNMHAVAEFDTVVFDARSEQRLFEKMQSLLDEHRELIDALIEERLQQRADLIDASARIIADLIVDAAAFLVTAPDKDDQAREKALESFRDSVCRREEQCVSGLLELHRFGEDDYDAAVLPTEDGQWGANLFSPAALKEFGVSTGGGAAAGALVGLTIDAFVGGASLGAGALIGAAAGALIGAGRSQGMTLARRVKGLVELRCSDATLQLLASRQLHLASALLGRGHASVVPLTPEVSQVRWKQLDESELKRVIEQSRLHPNWSPMTGTLAAGGSSPGRQDSVKRLATLLKHVLQQADHRS